MIGIIDYGMGNLRSVQKAFEFIGQEAVISSDPEVLKQADKVVLPGVGAFAEAMENLRSTKLIDVVYDAIERKKPFLGICLGMQLLFDCSQEGGNVQGLGIIKGEVVKFDLPKEYKVPHMGWNALSFRDCYLWDGIEGGAHTYFVHSYYVKPTDDEVVAATADYGMPFTAAIHRGNIFATQFHPEKSGEVGLAMLKNFTEVTA